MTSHATRALTDDLAPEAGAEQTLHWAVARAGAAPSELNSQPWRFAVGDAGVDLLLEPAARLGVVDGSGREAHLACGAALLNLRLALRGAGYEAAVTLCPDPRRPGLLARVLVTATSAPEPADDRDLRLAIAVRATHRSAFDPADIASSGIALLVAAAAREGALVAQLGAPDRSAFEALSRAAQHELWQDPAYRAEVARWTVPNHGRREDGVPGRAYGLTDWRARVEPVLVRWGRTPKAPEDVDAAAAASAPLLLVLGAAADTPEAWLRAGAGMQRMLLAATVAGISASFLNAALHTEEGRTEVARLAGLDHPQVVLRLGFARPDRPTRRRVVRR